MLKATRGVAFPWLTLCLALALNACASYHFPMFGVDSGPLRVKGTFKPAQVAPVDARTPIYVLVKPYHDARKNAPSRQIGDIKDTFISDLHSDKIVLDDDVAPYVTEAMKMQLAASGYRALSEGDANAGRADFVLTGRIERFTLNVHSKDHADMQVQTNVMDSHTGAVLWSGTVRERTRRFAGVMGDSRASVVHYLNESLRNLTKKTGISITASLTQARPDLFLQAGVPVPGVTVQAASPAGRAPPRAGSGEAPVAETGVLSLTTAPDAVRVYIGDVYYGTSPLTLHIAPGIYTVRLSADGYKEVRQKVSVRAAETTKWDVRMERRDTEQDRQ